MPAFFCANSVLETLAKDAGVEELPRLSSRHGFRGVAVRNSKTGVFTVCHGNVDNDHTHNATTWSIKSPQHNWHIGDITVDRTPFMSALARNKH
jgi:hypothetical protein